MLTAVQLSTYSTLSKKDKVDKKIPKLFTQVKKYSILIKPPKVIAGERQAKKMKKNVARH